MTSSLFLRAAYDRDAATYDARFRDQQRPKIDRLGELLPPPGPGERVLDVGAGTGLVSAHLARIEGWSQARCVGVDLSREMLRHAQRRGPSAVQADACRLPFRSASFGRVVCVTGLVLPEQLGPALTSICRVLADGGWLGLTVREQELGAAVDAVLDARPLERIAIERVAGDRLCVLRRRERLR